MLIDTHTHFDLPVYDTDREAYMARAYQRGVRHLVLIGYEARYFDRLVSTARTMDGIAQKNPMATITPHLAPGLHPLYIARHTPNDLATLEHYIKHDKVIAIGEIGLDTYPSDFNNIALLDKQKQFFSAQLELASTYQLPVVLHIRKAHADTLQLLKHHRFQGGGIAHSFSGGAQEAFAFIKQGFCLGLTGQLTNPNAKKLRRTVLAVLERFGLDYFVIETDCPDMTPITCQHLPVNEPSTLPLIAQALARLADCDIDHVTNKLWQNSCRAFSLTFN